MPNSQIAPRLELIGGGTESRRSTSALAELLLIGERVEHDHPVLPPGDPAHAFIAFVVKRYFGMSPTGIRGDVSLGESEPILAIDIGDTTVWVEGMGFDGLAQVDGEPPRNPIADARSMIAGVLGVPPHFVHAEMKLSHRHNALRGSLEWQVVSI